MIIPEGVACLHYFEGSSQTASFVAFADCASAATIAELRRRLLGGRSEARTEYIVQYSGERGITASACLHQIGGIAARVRAIPENSLRAHAQHFPRATSRRAQTDVVMIWFALRPRAAMLQSRFAAELAMSSRASPPALRALKREGRCSACRVRDGVRSGCTRRALKFCAALPAAGADVIELGFPFTDPMADGVSSIQKRRVACVESRRLAQANARARAPLSRDQRRHAAHPHGLRQSDGEHGLRSIRGRDARLRRRRRDHRRSAAGRRCAAPRRVRRARPLDHPPRHADDGC